VGNRYQQVLSSSRQLEATAVCLADLFLFFSKDEAKNHGIFLSATFWEKHEWPLPGPYMILSEEEALVSRLY
jgi:hypothetical protein